MSANTIVQSEQSALMALLTKMDARLSALEAKPAGGAGSVASEDASEMSWNTPDLMESFRKATTLRYNYDTSKNTLIWTLLCLAFSQSPERFKLTHGLHTTVDGSRTYFSLAFNLSVDGGPLKLGTIHVYGAARGRHFLCKTVDVKWFNDLHTAVVDFDIPSVGNGARGQQFFGGR